MRITLAVALAAVLVAGCSVDTAGPARAAEGFHSALASQQLDAACAMLAKQTADKLPDPGQSCAEALRELNLGAGGPVTEVSVWGDEAQVRLAGDTLFLRHYRDGWRVKAAGCQPVHDLPYECEVEN
jgi:hypothetical protein